MTFSRSAHTPRRTCNTFLSLWALVYLWVKWPQYFRRCLSYQKGSHRDKLSLKENQFTWNILQVASLTSPKGYSVGFPRSWLLSVASGHSKHLRKHILLLKRSPGRALILGWHKKGRRNKALPLQQSIVMQPSKHPHRFLACLFAFIRISRNFFG